ncbi:MAG: DUF2182 domain-containing protein [Alphaproteobacteria bacterium]|nr:DUF2182 domain-containing protein [Alphaproteobacteria bacterium]
MTAFEMTTEPFPSPSGSMPSEMAEQNGQKTPPDTMTMEPDTPPSEMSMEMAGMMQPAVWTLDYAVLMFFMWWIMMIAMMLPSAAPMILLFAAINRKQRERDAPFIPTGIFAFSYLVTWAMFSVVAVALHWVLDVTGFLTGMMQSTSLVLGGVLLIAAGVWQLTPLKHACLKHCRSPLQFISHHWRSGRMGAFRMGAEHGVFCLGCCWFLMGLLFYGGVMNLYWIIGLALYVLLEKTMPHGHWLGIVTGVGLAIWGGSLIALTL